MAGQHDTTRHCERSSQCRLLRAGSFDPTLEGCPGGPAIPQRHGRDELTAFADATYADNKESRKSVSGNAVMFGGRAVSWFSRTQRCVATSPSEAEYISLAETAKEVVAVGQVLDFLRPSVRYSPVVIYEDNVGAIHLAQKKSINQSMGQAIFREDPVLSDFYMV